MTYAVMIVTYAYCDEQRLSSKILSEITPEDHFITFHKFFA